MPNLLEKYFFFLIIFFTIILGFIFCACVLVISCWSTCGKLNSLLINSIYLVVSSLEMQIWFIQTKVAATKSSSTFKSSICKRLFLRSVCYRYNLLRLFECVLFYVITGKHCFFLKVCRQFKILKEVRILRYLHSSSTLLIPTHQNKAMKLTFLNAAIVYVLHLINCRYLFYDYAFYTLLFCEWYILFFINIFFEKLKTSVEPCFLP